MMAIDIKTILIKMLEEERVKRDKATEESKCRAKICKAACDLIRNLEKLKEIQSLDTK